MGLERFVNFLSKSINDGIEDINIKNNVRKILVNHVMFDINFIIYQEMINIENEINDIIKTILCLPHTINSYHVELMLKSIFNYKYWNNYNIDKIFDGYNEIDIVKNFILYITKPNENNQKIIELIIYDKILNTITNYIKNIHYNDFIKNIVIFFDGIPSVSKVIEQRRRRVKNHIESKDKKIIYKSLFENFSITTKKLNDSLSKKYDYEDENDLIFDFLKWINNKFSLDKSLSPSSDIIKNLENYLSNNLKTLFPNINIDINSSDENGEADAKIFKYISKNNIIGDICIHTIDSDLVHLILIQQSYYKIINKDINLSVIKYINNINNNIEYVQVLDAIIIIKNINELYNTLNNVKILNYKIIWDLCCLFYFFGNDHIIPSIEISHELGLEFFLKKHYQALNKNNIINISKNKIYIDFNNLNIILKKINETKESNITRIILQRFFKINNSLISLLIDKLHLNYNQIQEFLKKFIINRGLNISNINELDEDDLRRILINNINDEEKYKYIDFSIFNFDDNKKRLLINNINLIEDNLDYYSGDYMGLIYYSKPFYITDNSQLDLYNYILDKINSNLIFDKYNNSYEKLKIYQNILNDENKMDENLCDAYLKQIYYLVTTHFGNMEKYNSNNITFYKYNTPPSLNNLIEYLDKIKLNQYKIWKKEIEHNYIIEADYLNSVSHYLLITPHIIFNNLPDNVKLIIKKLELDNLWINDINNFDYRNIDIKKYLNSWKDAIKNNDLTLVSIET